MYSTVSVSVLFDSSSDEYTKLMPNTLFPISSPIWMAKLSEMPPSM